VVWGLDRVQPGEDVTVCEGVFDAAVVPNGVALLGKSASARQITAIGIRASRVNVMLDGDEAGVEAAKEVARRFRATFPRLRVTVVRVPLNEDPSSLGPERAMSIISQVG
jgi:DNA primase